MGKRDEADKEKNRVQSVLELLTKQSPLTIKQENFCNDACLERFLKAKGDSVKKTAKQLRNCLAWRDSIGTDTLIADEFFAELAEGVAYVAGHDDELRPVMIFRMKQDIQKFRSQKLFTRLVVFTLEVAIQTMAKNVDQFVLLLDAIAPTSELVVPRFVRFEIDPPLVSLVPPRLPPEMIVLANAPGGGYADTIFCHSFPYSAGACFFRSASAFLNIQLATLKIISDYYPGRLYKAFVIDPPSLFTYLWKGVKPFVELSTLNAMVSLLDYEDSLEYNDLTSYSQAPSFRFDSSSVVSSAKVSPCSSSRFSFTVSQHFDSVKPWYLSLTDTSTSKVGPTNPSPTFLGPNIPPAHSARSYSFASSVARSEPCGSNVDVVTKQFFPLTPMSQKAKKIGSSMTHHSRTTPKPSFFQSPALCFLRDSHHVSRVEKARESFVPYLKFYRRPYDETTYRSMMKPPRGGIISIVSPKFKRRHVHISQQF